MMTIREYFVEETHWEEETALWEQYQADEVDLYEWCAERGIDADAIDAATGVAILLQWAWDMCGD